MDYVEELENKYAKEKVIEFRTADEKRGHVVHTIMASSRWELDEVISRIIKETHRGWLPSGGISICEERFYVLMVKQTR